MSELITKSESALTRNKYVGTPITVSGNDLEYMSQSAEMQKYAGALTEEMEETKTHAETETIDMTEVCEQLDTISNALVLLTFFIIFEWVEQKIRSGVRRLMKYE